MSPEEFLERSQPDKTHQLYAVGIFEPNVTLYRQQVRALNLVHAIRLQHPEIDKLAVIGGGAFGATAAAAGATLGMWVRLYESREDLLPLQRGCDTRWVNPRYYEWPNEGSDSRYAALPIMNWESGTAGQVAEQLSNQFRHYQSVVGARLALRTRFVLDDLAWETDGGAVIEGHYSVLGVRKPETWKADAVIVATGLGTENSDYLYWRNDTFAQPVLGNVAQEYVVSGTGDGGLTDLARLKIANFRHERIFHELLDDADAASLQIFRDLSREAAAGGVHDDTWLFDSLDQVVGPDPENGPLGSVVRKLQERIRFDTTVTLNGRKPTFRTSLSLSKVALNNAVLAYLLYRLGAFVYREGALGGKDGSWSIDGEALGSACKVIVRHGVDQHAPMRAVHLESVSTWLAKQPLVPSTAEPIYPSGWWASNATDSAKSAALATEFVSPTMVTLASTFVSTLASVLLQFHDGDKNDLPTFRITLHRVIADEEGPLYQQVSPYRGTPLPSQLRERGGVGRVFRAQGGFVGLSIRHGKAVVFRRVGGKFRSMQKLINLSAANARTMDDGVWTAMAVPLFGANGQVLFVMYFDTFDEKFATAHVLEVARAACEGFVKEIDDAIRSVTLRQVDGLGNGHLATETQDADRLIEVGVVLEGPAQEALTFDTLDSPDLDVVDIYASNLA